MCSPGRSGPPVVEDERAGPRDRNTRIADTRSLLTARPVDAFVATASATGDPYLVPLTMVWVAERILLAMPDSTRTARNLTARPLARLSVGATRDVVMVDTVVERVVPVESSPELGEAYAAGADWDPRGLANHVFVVLRPVRVQAWREVNETSGRLLMRDGVWLEGESAG